MVLRYPSNALRVERRDSWGGTTLAEVSVPGGLSVGQWYTLRLERQGSGVSGEVYAGRVDPSVSVALATASATDAAHVSFTHVAVNGGHEYDSDDVRVSE